MRSAVLLLSMIAVSALINGAYAQTVPADGPAGKPALMCQAFDITQLESYRLYPYDTELMLALKPGELPLTSEFGVAYDELSLVQFGYADHIGEEHVEFLEGLDITLFSKHGDALLVGIDPSQGERLDEIRQQLKVMYPNVDIEVISASGLIYHTISQSSAVDAAIPDGARAPAIDVDRHAAASLVLIPAVSILVMAARPGVLARPLQS